MNLDRMSLQSLPITVPVLPVEKFIQNDAVLGVDAGVRTKNLHINQLTTALPDHALAHQHGQSTLFNKV